LARWAVLGKLVHPVENPTPFGDALLSAPGVFLFYLGRIVFPWPISINFAARPTVGVELLGFIIPAVIGTIIIVIVVLLVRRSYIKTAGAMLFFLPLLPAFNLTAFPVDQIVHDRYLYLPLFGALLIVFAALEKRISPRWLLIVSAVVAIPFSVQTFLGNRIWASDLTLWEQAVRADPASASNYSQLGTALSLAGRQQEAVDAFNSALGIAPFPNAYLGRAQALIATGQFEEAVRDMQTVTEMKTDDINAYTLYQSYEALAVALQRKNDLGFAERSLRDARKRLPIYFAALTEKIAVILYLRNQKADALAELEAAQNEARTELLPNSKAVFFRLGLLYAEKGDKARAKAAFQEFLKLTARFGNETMSAERKAAAEALRQLG
jgi:tetratricopeptide (TPR) repeat protein